MIDGEYLKISRIRLGFSQKEMADMMLMSRPSVIAIEADKSRNQLLIKVYSDCIKKLRIEYGLEDRTF